MNQRIAIVIFLTALVLRLSYLASVYDGPDSLLSPDSGMYLLLAEELQKTHITGMPISDDMVGTFRERTPGYVYFVAGFKIFIGNSLFPIVILQAVFDSIVCVLIGHLAAFFHRRLVLPAGLLAAFNFNMIIHSSLILSDGIFLLPFIGGLVASANYIQRPSLPKAFLAAMLFATALLVRPVLLYFPPVLMLFFAIMAWRHRIHMRQAILHQLAVGVAFALINGPLLMRNYQDFGHVAYVSQTGTHALFWVYPQAQEFVNGAPREESVARMHERLTAYRNTLEVPGDLHNPFAQSAEMKTVASQALWEMGPWAIVKAWVVGSVINLTSPAIISSPTVRKMDRPSFTETPGINPIYKVWNYLAANRTFTFVMLPAAVLTVIWRLGSGLSLLQLWLRKEGSAGSEIEDMLNPAQTYFLLLVGAYIFAVTGPVVGVKYRLPVEPMLDIFLAAGLLWSIDFWRKFPHVRQTAL